MWQKNAVSVDMKSIVSIPCSFMIARSRDREEQKSESMTIDAFLLPRSRFNAFAIYVNKRLLVSLQRCMYCSPEIVWTDECGSFRSAVPTVIFRLAVLKAEPTASPTTTARTVVEAEGAA